MEQNREPKSKPCIYIQLIYDREAKNIQWGKDSLFDKWCWGNSIATSERMRLDPYLTSYTKINSKQIKGLNVRPETMKLLGENIRDKLLDIDLGNAFLNLKNSKNKGNKSKNNKWDYIKLNVSAKQRKPLTK